MSGGRRLALYTIQECFQFFKFVCVRYGIFDLKEKKNSEIRKLDGQRNRLFTSYIITREKKSEIERMLKNERTVETRDEMQKKNKKIRVH